MVRIMELLQMAGFDLEAIETISEAYIQTRKPVRDVSEPDPINEIIALRILSLAKQGERDVDRLRAGALATIPVKSSLDEIKP
jgi:hypothetical protein